MSLQEWLDRFGFEVAVVDYDYADERFHIRDIITQRVKYSTDTADLKTEDPMEGLETLQLWGMTTGPYGFPLDLSGYLGSEAWSAFCNTRPYGTGVSASVF